MGASGFASGRYKAIRDRLAQYVTTPKRARAQVQQPMLRKVGLRSAVRSLTPTEASASGIRRSSLISRKTSQTQRRQQ